MAKHSPEPWTPTANGIEDANGEIVLTDQSDSLLSEVNKERILACVNAAKGIPTETLEKLARESSEARARATRPLPQSPPIAAQGTQT